ncbi:unnamed protein product [Candida verbasci]|uniref:Thymidylate kinase n=1 Tax=Candida verbasci TaxID=1227364 RepID=A0A9W4TUH1_9ASCO|nr:unnamed protein product [Candida verbasci]
MARGQLILIEGLDRSGKSTQAELIAKHLQPSKLIKFPNRSTPIGKVINEYLENKEFELTDESAHLLFSANRWEIAHEIEELLNNGNFVILDRYIYSGIAYTLSKETGPNSVLSSVDWLIGPDKGLPKPDLTIFLSLDIDEISSRKGWGNERYEMKQFQIKVKESFMKILNQDDSSIKIVEVDKSSIEQVNEKLMNVINSEMKDILIDSPINKI